MAAQSAAPRRKSSTKPAKFVRQARKPRARAGASWRMPKARAAGDAARGKGVVRYAVVGLGYFAQAAVLPAFQKARNSRLVALVSDDATKIRSLQHKYKVPQAVDYDGYDALLESGTIDAVYICLPNDMHRDFAVRSANAGIHVLCEKPMATTVEDCEAMIEAAERNHVRLMVAYRLHFEPANLAAIEAIRTGRIGKPRFFNSTFSFPVAAGNIRTQRERGGGPLYDIGIYCINAARYLFQDEPIDVVARMATGSDPKFAEVEETVSAILTFPGERVASFTASFGTASSAWYEVAGTKGSLVVDNAYEFTQPMTLDLYIGDRTRTKKFPKRDQVAPELVHFSDCILQGHDPEPSGKEGLIDVAIIRAIQESAATGRRIPIHTPERERRPNPRMAASLRPHGKPHMVHVQEPNLD